MTETGMDFDFALRFLNSFCHRPWLDVLTSAREARNATSRDGCASDDDDEDDDEDTTSMEALDQLLQESYTALRLAMFSPPSPFSASGIPALLHCLRALLTLFLAELGTGLQNLFTLDYYSKLLGLLEMNQNAICINSPLQTYAVMLHRHLFMSYGIPFWPDEGQASLINHMWPIHTGKNRHRVMQL